MSLVRLGLDGNRAAILDAIRASNAPVLVSANNLWDARWGRFRDTAHLADLDVVLDSGGFMAMKKHGGYRFSIKEFVTLAAKLKPTWYAAMDFCCEPEITYGNARETFLRIERTALYWEGCLDAALDLGVPPPIPVLQGWRAEHYVTCARMIYRRLHWGRWPQIVGIGSVCRRHLHGPDGVLQIVARLDSLLPDHIRFHLFGVKGAVAKRLAGHPRFASMDSCAFDRGSRWECYKTKTPRTNAVRAAAMMTWYDRQTAALASAQAELFA